MPRYRKEAFVAFGGTSIQSKTVLLYTTVRSTALDRLRSEQRRSRREALRRVTGEHFEPQFTPSTKPAGVGRRGGTVA
jgi:DNA-directed RNA polymerase specialized sigma24 family protein